MPCSWPFTWSWACDSNVAQGCCSQAELSRVTCVWLQQPHMGELCGSAGHSPGCSTPTHVPVALCWPFADPGRCVDGGEGVLRARMPLVHGVLTLRAQLGTSRSEPLRIVRSCAAASATSWFIGALFVFCWLICEVVAVTVPVCGQADRCSSVYLGAECTLTLLALAVGRGNVLRVHTPSPFPRLLLRIAVLCVCDKCARALRFAL